jgi:hypothetical protein
LVKGQHEANQGRAAMKHLAGCRVQRFEELGRLCHLDPAFPASSAEWASLVADANAAAARDGHVFDEVEIDVENFARWCAVVEVVPCLDALRAYAIVRRAQAAGRSFGASMLDEQDPGRED